MRILTIDSAMSGCSAGVYDTEQDMMLSEVSMQMTRGQAEQLMPIIMSACDQAGVALPDIDRIAVTKGPGAFTGIRIGLASAKSLGSALDIPVFGVCTLHSVLESYRISGEQALGTDYHCVLLETKRKDFYIQLFDREFEPLNDAKTASLEGVLSDLEGKNSLIVGDANVRFSQEAGRELPCFDCVMPMPFAIARLSLRAQIPNSDPVYLRPPDVSMPKTPPRKIAQ